MDAKINPFVQKIIKPWGYELIFTPSDSPVVGKLLHINKGARFSLQYHEIKEETLVLISGEANIILGEDKNDLEKITMEKNKGYFIHKGLIHRCEAVADCEILESSTPERGTTVRLEDDYQRLNETQDDRKQERKNL